MYILCSCGALFERKSKGARGAIRHPAKIKHFQQEGHTIAGIYTFPDNIPGSYFLVKSGNRS